MPLSLRTSKITSMSSSMPPWMNTRPVSRRPSARFLSYSFGSQKKVSLVFSDSYSEYYLCDKSLSCLRCCDLVTSLSPDLEMPMWIDFQMFGLSKAVAEKQAEGGVESQLPLQTTVSD